MIDAVRTRRAFSALSRSRSRGRSGPLWVVRSDAPAGCPEGDGPPAVRVAYSVGRAAGGAVARNRVRRRLRAAVDDADRSGALQPGLYLVGASSDVLDAPFDRLTRDLRQALAGAR